ncbi:Crp/Fnr family transcriptional regulator [Salimicrobium humidisoli]|uniref:cAMP-binding protein n=1 Tax=Salimicrobium humidisoli TaxID=2029857 RepID=A0ABX4HTG3_9BACI|nr:Crp/Fnr family transcriptional regulator [Salimicrobium humidisoli]PBB06516.1 cAMP-binding protein [Salimicrobium humidisoli]
MNKLRLLSEISLFEEMPDHKLKEIDMITQMTTVKKGTLIYTPDTPVEVLYFLKQGQVRLYRVNEEGKQFTIDVLVDGNLFGETSSLSLSDDSTYAEAMTDSYICIVKQENMGAFLEDNPATALRLISLLTERLKELQNFSEKMALSDVKHRPLYLLLILSEKTGHRQGEWQSVEAELTHKDLAHMVGSTRETISSTISTLKKEGYLHGKTPFSVHAAKAEAFLAHKTL